MVEFLTSETTEISAEQFREMALAIETEVGKVIVGQKKVVRHVLTGILAGGHVLLEGVPGLGKTMLIRTLGDVLELEFSRVQFTPDLMPSDITGTDIIEENRETGHRSYRFLRGPIFANVVLADEINRTPPKTQAALLQAMQERELTISGRTYKLDEPFFVLATQNPIEQEGTYSLPEAALDRFMFMVMIDYPNINDEYRIVKKTTSGRKVSIEPILNKEDILLFQERVRRSPISDRIIKYSVNIARATRPDDPLATDVVKKYLKWGAGPRAGQFMILGAKARALIHNRVTASYEDVQYISRLVLRHRIIPNFSAEADGVTSDQIINDIIKNVALPK